MNAPIFIAGTGRCGSTLLQHILSAHRDLHIHGQPPGGWDRLVENFYKQSLEAAVWGMAANEETRGVFGAPHYGGSRPNSVASVFASFIQSFITGNGPTKPRWGVKSLLWGLDSGFLNELWPDSVKVLCIRHPLATFRSYRGTFHPNMPAAEFTERWKCAARTAIEADVVVHIDRLEDRQSMVRRILVRAGLSDLDEACSAMWQLVDRWPQIHASESSIEIPEADCNAVMADEEVKMLVAGFGYA